MKGYIRYCTSALREHGVWLTAIGTVVVFFALFLFGDADAVVAVLLEVDPRAIIAMLCLVLVSYGIRFLKWAYYLRVLDIAVPARESGLVFFSGLMLVVTPGKVGEVWKAWFLRDLSDVSVSRTVPVVGAERVTDLLALSSFAFLAVLLYRRSVLVLIGIAVVMIGGLGLLQWRSLCRRVLAWLRTVPVLGSYATEFAEFYERTYALFRPRPLGIAMVLSLLAWGLEGIALWVVLRGFGAPADPLLGLAVFGLGSVIGALSFLPGGLGAAEASMVGTLLAVGYARPVAVGATLLIRVGTLWYGAILGAAVFGLHRLLTRTAERQTTFERESNE